MDLDSPPAVALADMIRAVMRESFPRPLDRRGVQAMLCVKPPSVEARTAIYEVLMGLVRVGIVQRVRGPRWSYLATAALFDATVADLPPLVVATERNVGPPLVVIHAADLARITHPSLAHTGVYRAECGRLVGLSAVLLVQRSSDGSVRAAEGPSDDLGRVTCPDCWGTFGA